MWSPISRPERRPSRRPPRCPVNSPMRAASSPVISTSRHSKKSAARAASPCSKRGATRRPSRLTKLLPTLVGPFEAKEFGELSVAAPSGRGGAQAVYVLTHVDVFPAHKVKAVELVKALAEAGRKDLGNLFFDVVQWDGHPNHFALAEGWSDRGAFEASLMAPHTKDFREKLTPLEGALYDE